MTQSAIWCGANVAEPMWPASDWVSFAVFHFKLAPGAGHLAANWLKDAARTQRGSQQRYSFLMVILRLAFRHTNTTAVRSQHESSNNQQPGDWQHLVFAWVQRDRQHKGWRKPDGVF